MFWRACWVGVGALPRLTYRPFAAPSCLRSRSLNPTSLPTKAPYQAPAGCRRIRARAGSVLTTSTRSTPRHHARSCRATAVASCRRDRPARCMCPRHSSRPMRGCKAVAAVWRCSCGRAIGCGLRAALPARTCGRWRAQLSPILRRNMRYEALWRILRALLRPGRIVRRRAWRAPGENQVSGASRWVWSAFPPAPRCRTRSM